MFVVRSALVMIPLVVFVSAAELAAAEAQPVDDSALRSAIERSIPLLEKGMQGSAAKRECFTCHNQALPVIALAEAPSRGFTIDEMLFDAQLEHTAKHLRRGHDRYLEGRGQGGKVLTAGYALWTLAAGRYAGDDNTAAVTHFILQDDRSKTHWDHSSGRPPSSGSDFTATYVALKGLAEFGTKEQKADIESRLKKATAWMREEQGKDTEDKVFRLLAMPYLEVPADEVEAAVTDLLDEQREDGGWAQTPEMTSDAYATATALVALLDAGGVAADHPAVQRGLTYLLGSQLDDGSWHVVTRADPIQEYYETGFPHGEDQFISITATSWATWAFLLSLAETP